MRIAEGVHSIGQRKGGRSHAYLFEHGNEVTLFDDHAEPVLECIRAIGRSPSDLKHIALGPNVALVPSYGHGLYERLSVTDERNKEIWEGLGFEVRMLGDFHPFAANLGAAHCIKKYLARR